MKGRSHGRAGWLGLLLLGGAALAASPPTLQERWRAVRGGLEVVTTDEPADLGWLFAQLGNARVTVVSPSALTTELNRTLPPWRLLLFSRAHQEAWPSEVFHRLPADPRVVPPDQVQGVVCGGYHRAQEALLLAPDDESLREAFVSLSRTRPGELDEKPLCLFAWHVATALSIGGDPAWTREWVARQTTSAVRYSVRAVAPERLEERDLAGAGLAVVALTQSAWARLPRERQQLLRSVLPPPVTEALTARTPTIASGVTWCGRTACVAAAAPHARTLPVLLGTAPTTGGFAGFGPLSLKDLASPGGHAELKDLRACRTASLIANGESGTEDAAELVAGGLRPALAGCRGWTFLEADPGHAEARFVVHLTRVVTRTQHQAEAPVRLLTLGRGSMLKWRQTVSTDYVVDVAGSLDVLGPDGALVCTVPLQLCDVTTGDKRNVYTECRYAADGPRAVALPPERRSVPEQVFGDALAKVAAQAEAGMRSQLCLPEDPPSVETVQAVTVRGAGPLTLGRFGARTAAREDAARQAVEQALGTWLMSDTAVRDGQLSGDWLSSHAQGYARVVRELDEEERDGRLLLTCEVQVDKAPLRQALLASGALRAWRLMVVVPERHLSREVPDPAAETTLAGVLIKAGFPVVEPARTAELRARRAELEALRGNAELARQLRATYGAKVLVTGEAFSQEAGSAGGRPQSVARVELRAYDLDTAEVFAVGSAQGTASDLTAELAGKAALERAALLAAEVVQQPTGSTFSDELLRHIVIPRNGGMSRCAVTATGFASYTAAARFGDALTALRPGIAEVRPGEYVEGSMTYELELTESARRELPALLENAPELHGFGVRIVRVTASTIECRLGAQAETVADGVARDLP